MDRDQSSISRRNFLKASMIGITAAAFGGPLTLRSSAASTQANSKVNLAVVGCGGQGRGDMCGMLSLGGFNLVALCDPDAAQIAAARAAAGANGTEAKAYEDYRKLLDDAASYDAVLIGTPDHWHAPLCKAFMKAHKHIYCEKPLTHTIAEARELRVMARKSKVVTQMGNQGSSYDSMRRCIEIIKAGALGDIKDVYCWGIGVGAREDVPTGEDPVPDGFNWDLWIGPSPVRPYQKNSYHPFNWRGWYDFGNGGLADFCCHALNLPMRALDLDYPKYIEMNVQPNGQQAPDKAAVEYHFEAREKLCPVVIHWMGGAKPPTDLTQPLSEVYGDKDPGGVLIVGDKGFIHTSHWNGDGLIRLQGEQSVQRVPNHEGTKDIPQSIPRVGGHDREWLDAINGQGKTFSDFDTGGKLTEIGLAGVVAMRAGKSLEWNGDKMSAKNAPEAAKFIHPKYRKKWVL